MNNQDLLGETRHTRIGRWILLAGFGSGLAFFGYYFTHGLVTAHYDAKAHLVVARRLLDAPQPGYSQMGAHWLPLIHLLYLPFVASDSQYHSGFLPGLLSVVAFALSGWLVYRIAVRVTGSIIGGVFAAVTLLSNPNLQYLQSCPMTEPVYMVLQLLAIDALMAWREAPERRLPWVAALWTAASAMCRYEGWYFIAGVFLLLLYDWRSGRISAPRMVRAVLAFGVAFALPAAAHFGYVYVRLGDTFLHRVIQGNPAPYRTYKRPFLSVFYHVAELAQISTIVVLSLAAAGLVRWVRDRDKRAACMPILLLWVPSLINISALYWGLIYRVRYSVLLLPAVAVYASLAMAEGASNRRLLLLSSAVVMALPWVSWSFPQDWRYHDFFAGPGVFFLPALALVLVMVALSLRRYRWALLGVCVATMQFPDLQGEQRAMLAETLEHTFIESERVQVLDYLRHNYDGSRILIDMGKQAPLVYDSGLAIREFVYNEGNLDIWWRALRSPANEVGWLCAEKGDEVWRLVQVDPHWADGYSLAVQTENLLLYRIASNHRGVLLRGRENE